MRTTGTPGVRLHAVERRLRTRSFEHVKVHGQRIAV
ncbi:hypothetical protein JSY14_07610 [Brachybacterium sp. EF45031]|nr:hypothetical protein [Brachybacterium sillae]